VPAANVDRLLLLLLLLQLLLPWSPSLLLLLLWLLSLLLLLPQVWTSGPLGGCVKGETSSMCKHPTIHFLKIE